MLQADHSISCDSPSYEAWIGLPFVLMVLIYPIGIPMLYLARVSYCDATARPSIRTSTRRRR